MKNLKLFFFLINFLFLVLNLEASSSFEAKLILQVTNSNGDIVYEKNKNINYSNNSLNIDVKYKKTIERIIRNIINLEKKYVNEELYIVDSIRDDENKNWTISYRILSKDTSISQFFLQDNKKKISGWINRDNKDIFGLRIFNF